MKMKNNHKNVLLVTSMVAVECTTVGSNILFKAATLKGMSYYVFTFYSHVAANLFLLPWPFLFPSAAALPSSKLPLICRICLLSFIGVLSLLLGYKGIAYSSPTLASAMSNLTPAFTFALAITFRMEKLAIKSSSTQARVIGTILSISGALVMVLYKGPTIFSTSSSTPSHLHQSSSQSNWVVGGLLLASQYLLFSIWYIIQTQVMKIYPSELVVVFTYNLCVTIISAPVCFLAEKHTSAWRLRSDIKLNSIVYSGFFVAFLSNIVHTYGLRMKGPVYIAIFKPLSIAIAAAMGVMFLGDALYVGSVVGTVVISIGFYAVLWGKAKEEGPKEDNGSTSLATSSNTQALIAKSGD